MEVRSPMPGVVLEVRIADGQSVDMGMELLLVESMKMEIPIEAPGPGTVRSVHVSVGDQVEEDQLLVLLSTD